MKNTINNKLEKLAKDDLLLIKEIVTNYDFENEEAFSYKEIFEKINENFQNIDIYSYPDFQDIIDESLNLARSHLRKKPGNIKKKSKAYQDLKFITSNLEALSFSITEDILNEYNGDVSSFLEYLIFEDRKEGRINKLLKDYPYLLREKNNQGKSLILGIIELYLKSFDNINDIIYLDALLEEILKRDAAFEKEVLEEEREKFEEFRNNYEFPKTNKEYFEYWLDLLDDRLNLRTRNIETSEALFQAGIDETPSFGVLEKSRRITNNIESIQRDFRKGELDRRYITIDASSIGEKDDAISVIKRDGFYHVGVHITSVMDFLPIESSVFEDAWNRTTSLYRGGRNIMQLLPQPLTASLSLEEGENHLVTSFYFYIQKDGEVQNFYIQKEVIPIHNNLTYAEVNSILDGEIDGGKTLREILLNFKDLTDTTKRKRRINKTYAKYKKYGAESLSGNRVLISSNAESIVENLMYLTNHYTASLMNDQNLPFLYRNHQLNDELEKKYIFFNKMFHDESLEQSEKALEDLMAIYPSPYYSVECLGHDGLVLKSYCHITSPLRRLSDLVAMNALNKCFLQTPSDRFIIKEEEFIKEAAEQIETRSQALKYTHRRM